MPWFVVLVCASAIGAASTSAAPASAAIPLRYLMRFLPGASQMTGTRCSVRVFPSVFLSMLAQPPGSVKKPLPDRLSGRHVAIHCLDLLQILLVDELALELHRRRQLVILRRQLLLN